MLSLFYVNLALTLALVAAILILKPLKAYQRSLLGIIVPHILVQLLLTLRALGVKADLQFLLGISYPLQVLQILFLERFFQAFTPAKEDVIKTPKIYWLGLGFSLCWYAGAHLFFDISSLHYGTAHHPYNLGRYISSTILVVYTAKRIFKNIEQFKVWGESHLSDITQLRLPILYGLTVYFLCTFALTILDFITGPDIELYVVKPFLFFIGIFGLVIYCLKTADVLVADAPEPQAEKLSAQEMERIQNKLVKAIQVDHIYLNPELRLTDLAKAIDERPYKVTLVLSRMIGKTFNDYINAQRVEQAKAMLQDSKFAHLNLVGIAMESGFNSKSVFNDVFKKLTGQTPSAFRKS